MKNENLSDSHNFGCPATQGKLHPVVDETTTCEACLREAAIAELNRGLEPPGTQIFKGGTFKVSFSVKGYEVTEEQRAVFQVEELP